MSSWLLAACLAWLLPRAEQVSSWQGDVDAPVAEVWRALTTPEGLHARGFSGVARSFSVGGILHATRTAEDGRVAEELALTVLAYEPERMLATRDAADPPGVWRVAYLSALSAKRTRLRLSVVDPRPGEPAAEDAARFAALCEQERAELERAARSLERESDARPPGALPADVPPPKPPRASVAERVVDAPPAEVWRLYTTREGAECWMVARASIELALGGVMRTSYDPASTLDDASTIRTHILAYEPGRMLATRFEVSEQAKSLELAETTWVVLTLEPVEGDRTRVRCAHLGFGEGGEWERVFAFFDRGNAYELEKLAERCATPGATK